MVNAVHAVKDLVSSFNLDLITTVHEVFSIYTFNIYNTNWTNYFSFNSFYIFLLRPFILTAVFIDSQLLLTYFDHSFGKERN